MGKDRIKLERDPRSSNGGNTTGNEPERPADSAGIEAVRFDDPTGTGAGGIGSRVTPRAGDGGEAPQSQGTGQVKAPPRLAVAPKRKRVRRTKKQIAAAKAAAGGDLTVENSKTGKRPTQAAVNHELVSGLLDAFDVLAGVVIGDGLSQDERALIEPSLERVMARLSTQASKKAQALVDPVCILAGFGLFALRVTTVQAVQSPKVPRMPTEKPGQVPVNPMAEKHEETYSAPSIIADLLTG